MLSRIPFIDMNVYKLAHADADEVGVSTYLQEMHLAIDGDKLTVSNNHWCHMWPGTKATRTENKTNFRRHLLKGHTPVSYVLGGDLNTWQGEQIIRNLGKVYDMITGSFINPTYRYNGKLLAPFLNVDYVGVPKAADISITDFVQLDRTPSDHCPLLATIGL